ncbi:MAG: glycosyltransferase family 2 protein [Saprospiraceae bacterium]|nr:glycosyltransferase family 2 protein [Saprospiraceae bacterium]MCB9323645.1 glycosyltransferase family 2 protein [Lewinellaceae bacterium]
MNQSDPKISILVPVYNALPFLRDCLEAVLQQTEQHWELIAVNDFSEDESGVLLETYTAKDPRIKVLNNTEKGIIPALRLAFSQSTGQLITRMDADDIMMPGKLEALKRILLQNGLGTLATGKVKYISETRLGGGYLRYEEWLNQRVDKNDHFNEIYRECVIPSPCWMLWKQDLESCGAFSSDTYPEDYDLCFRFYKKGLNPVGSPEVLHYWRDHAGRSSRNDPHYANQQYFSLKLPRFLELDRMEEMPLVLWGAGNKGKQLASMLSGRKKEFRWLCNSPSKWGHKVNGVVFEPVERIAEMSSPQIIIAVGNPQDQQEIRAYLNQLGKQNGRDYFFFC